MRTQQRRTAPLVIALTVVLGMLAAACGDGGDASTDTSADDAPTEEVPTTEASDPTTTHAGSTPENAEPSDPPAGEGAFRTVETIDGAVDIPIEPQRIVAISDQNALLPLIELGVVPVASHGDVTDEGEGFFRRLDDFDTTGVEWLGSFREPNLEAVAAQRPDLIVTDAGAGADQYELLAEIAPVVRVDHSGQPLVDGLLQWAEIIGRSERGVELRADYEARIADAVASIGDPGEITLAIVTSWNSGATFWYADGIQATNQVVNDLQLTRTDAWELTEFSIEQFPDHIADFVVVYDFGGREQPDVSIDDFVESPVFRAHPAVAAGQWARVDATQTVGSGWSKLQNLIDVLEPLLTDSDLDRSIDP